MSACSDAPEKVPRCGTGLLFMTIAPLEVQRMGTQIPTILIWLKEGALRRRYAYPKLEHWAHVGD
jgi:hypothetical protein